MSGSRYKTPVPYCTDVEAHGAMFLLVCMWVESGGTLTDSIPVTLLPKVRQLFWWS